LVFVWKNGVKKRALVTHAGGALPNRSSSFWGNRVATPGRHPLPLKGVLFRTERFSSENPLEGAGGAGRNDGPFPANKTLVWDYSGHFVRIIQSLGANAVTMSQKFANRSAGMKVDK
jgi:hypothetical protein